MDLDDLMKGDWVFVISTQKSKKVIEIRNNWVVLDDSEFYWHDDFRPIPLTFDILEANGFKMMPLKKIPLSGPYFWCHWELKVLSMEVKYSICAYKTPLLGMLVIIKKPNAREPTLRIQIKFVHEFQNLLRLCEINKEIVLC